MKRLSSRSENHDLGYRLPYIIDQNDGFTAHSSTHSNDSISYIRTYSQSSTFSDRTDNSSYSYEASPSLGWPVNVETETPHSHSRPALTRLEMKQHKYDLDLKYDDGSAVDSGGVCSILVSRKTSRWII